MSARAILRPFRGPVTASPVEPPLRSVPAALFLAVIHVVSSIPGDQIGIPVSDKLAHFAEYAVLGALLLFAVTAFPWGTNMTAAAGAIAFAALYAALDELHQSMVPGRYSSLADWAADLLGACFAVLVIRAIVARSETA